MADIQLKLYKPFVAAWNKMRTKYGEEFEILNGLHMSNLNFSDFIDNFVQCDTVADATIDSNANSSTKDIRTLLNDMTKPHTKLLAFNKIFYEMTKTYNLKIAQQWLEQEWNGGLYLHDASSSTFLPYCFAHDLDQLVEKGLFFIDKFKAAPAKHLSTFNDHVLEFVSYTSNRQSGAVGLPSFLIYSFWFWKKDVENGYFLKDPETYRDQYFQKFIYDLNQPYLRVTECAFTNISIFDREYLMGLFGGRQYPDGTYVMDYVEEIIDYQKAFMREVDKVRSENMFTFPVLTYSLLYQDGHFVDEEFAKWANDNNMKWCDSNFFIGENVSILSNCCRLLSDTTKLKGFINSIGGTSLKIGSVKVNTINLRRIALESGYDREKYIQILADRVDLCIKTLDIIRGILQRNVEKGLLPNYSYKLIEFQNQYNTIGITALYEALNDFGLIDEDEFGYKTYSNDAIDFAKQIFSTIKLMKDIYNFDYSINIEAVPAENCNVKLAKKDELMYPNSEYQYFIYSNQWIPLMEKCSISEKIRLGTILDKECEGGVIAHINVEGDFADPEQGWKLLNEIAKKGLVYFAYNKEISVCGHGHAFFGEICPNCKEHKTDSYCRIVGFLTPVNSYSAPRKREYHQRKFYKKEEL